MAFFKKRKLSDGKWHAIAANLQRPATIDDVADELAARSTVSRADTYAAVRTPTPCWWSWAMCWAS